MPVTKKGQKMENVKEEMLKLISEFTEDGAVIEDDTELKALNIDSLVFIKMMVAVEKKFDIKINGAMLDVAEFEKVGELIDYIQKIKDGVEV